jgi:hypothetical protein
MKNTLLLSVMALGSLSAMANCTVELQYQGSVLGQNIFSAQVCRDAIRECKRTQKTYERNHMLPSEELSCVKFDDVVVNPPNDGPVIVDPINTDPSPMSRYQALRILEDAEGDSRQAEENFDIIMNYVNSGAVRLRDGVDSFVMILTATGSGNTTEARNGFRSVMDASFKTGISSVVLSQQLSDNIKLENDANQGVQNFDILINLSQNTGLDPVELMVEFNQVLVAVGTGSTTDARTLFNIIATTKRVNTRLSVVVNGALEILAIENDANQTAQNISLVNQAAQIRGVSFSEAKNTMIDLLNRYGSGSTTTVQNKFRKVFNI